MDLQKCDAKMYFCKCFLFIVFFLKKKNTKKHRIFASNFCKGGLCFLSNKKRAFAKIHFCITFLQSNKNKSQKMMINLIERDFSRRRQACKYELSRLTLKSIIENRNIGEQERWRAITKLRDLPRNSSRTRLRNRCVFTGRGRSVYRFCKLSRIELRRLAGAGKLPGVTKSSW